MRSMFALLLLFVSTTAFATSPWIKLADLTKIEADPKLGKVLKGSVEVKEHEVVLILTIDTCPKGALCVLGPVDRLIRLPVVSIETDGCGAVVYTATKDLRPADGPFQQIIVADNTRNMCESVLPWDPTIVTYEVITSGFGAPPVRTFSVFSGDYLR